MKTTSQLNVLRHFVKETWWMARRYADNRSTYAPDIFNRALCAIKGAGMDDLVEQIGNEPIYAADGMYGEWDPERKMFKGSPSKEHEGSAWHLTVAEKERSKNKLPCWKNKKTGKLYHVITMAEDATNGPSEGTRMVVYFDELRVFVRELEEFMEKFEMQENTEC